MSNCNLFYPAIRTCRSETEIRNLFERHTKALLDQKWKMISEIGEWQNNLVRQIHEHVVKQKATVEQIYNEQVQHLKTKCQEFLDTALIYEEREDREVVRQLLEQCHALKIAMNAFEYPEEPIPFIRLREEKRSVNVKDSASALDKMQKKSTIDGGFRKIATENTREFRSSPSISASFNQTKLPLLTILSTTGNDSRNSGVMNNHNMVEKCPACSLTFPLSMSTNERSKHVNQHFGDN